MTATLPAFRVRMNDGTTFVTSMAEGVTLARARAYYMGQAFTEEDQLTGEETTRTVVDVTPIPEAEEV